MLTNEVRNRVLATIEQNYLDAESYYGRKFKRPTIKFEKRGMTAGIANFSRNLLNYNAILLMENQDTFMARTVPHEVAHLIDAEVNPANFESNFTRGRNGFLKLQKRDLHGKSFKFIMTTVLKCDDDSRCHTYDITNAKVGGARAKIRHTWKCNSCGSTMNLTPYKHKAMELNNRTYRPRNKGCSFNHTYSYVGLKGQTTPTTLPIAADNPSTPPSDLNKVALTLRRKNMSKLDICRSLYSSATTRQDNIRIFVTEAMCTKAGAATYYAKIKKETK